MLCFIIRGPHRFESVLQTVEQGTITASQRATATPPIGDSAVNVQRVQYFLIDATGHRRKISHRQSVINTRYKTMLSKNRSFKELFRNIRFPDFQLQPRTSSILATSASVYEPYPITMCEIDERADEMLSAVERRGPEPVLTTTSAVPKADTITSNLDKPASMSGKFLFQGRRVIPDVCQKMPLRNREQ